MAESGTVSRSSESVLEFLLDSINRNMEKALESVSNWGAATYMTLDEFFNLIELAPSFINRKAINIPF